jgi:hypothetical protein
MIYGGACPNPFGNPPLLGNPYPYSLSSPLTYLESLLSWRKFPSTLIPGWPYTDPPFSSSFPFPLPQRFPISNTCLPTSYDDIEISASHSPIHVHHTSITIHVLLYTSSILQGRLAVLHSLCPLHYQTTTL